MLVADGADAVEVVARGCEREGALNAAVEVPEAEIRVGCDNGRALDAGADDPEVVVIGAFGAAAECPKSTATEAGPQIPQWSCWMPARCWGGELVVVVVRRGLVVVTAIKRWCLLVARRKEQPNEKG